MSDTLDAALKQFRSSHSAADVNFTVKYYPYQLYPEASNQGEDKYEWCVPLYRNPRQPTHLYHLSRYKRTKYNNSEEQMKRYTTLMSAYGVGVGIDFRFHGIIANTLSAHRLIQHFQEENGPETADKIVNSLYKQYFEEEAHPTAPITLLQAALDGGVERSKAEAFVGDEYEALPETKLLIKEQAGNGVECVSLFSDSEFPLLKQILRLEKSIHPSHIIRFKARDILPSK